MKKNLIKVHPLDNVAIALKEIRKGTNILFEGKKIQISVDVKAKHKIALEKINEEDKIIMYGVLVGSASQEIQKGETITTENVKHQSEKMYGKTQDYIWTPPDVSKWKNRTFLGYYRKDGQVGTQNVWLFFPLVFCENRNIEVLKKVFEIELLNDDTNRYRSFLRSLISQKNESITANKITSNAPILKNIEVKFITHQGGCGGIRQDSESLARLLAGYVNNPNVAGATILSLGCQNLQVQVFKNALSKISPNFYKPMLIYEQQKMGITEEMLNTIIKESFDEIIKADKIERKPAPLSKLKIGLECGGSDGFSGISANPTLGHVSDVISALKGSVILSEFPELCGVEQEIFNRCLDDRQGERFLQLMRDFEKSAVNAGSGFDMNPSPGNIKDGLITDAMKSAGAAKKGGTSPIIGVLDYGEYVEKPGLNLLCSPGNDVESTTAMAGAGSNIILFTTGLGTPTGNPITPVIKIASNSELAEKMPDIIDIDTGAIIYGEKSIEEMGDILLDYIIDFASGKKTKAMKLNQNDFIPWKRGVSL